MCEHATLDAVFFDRDRDVVCEQVNLDSPVGRLGLRPGDELVAFDGRPVATANQFLNCVTTFPAGWPVEVAFRHDGRVRRGWVRLTRLPYGQRRRPAPRVAPRRTEEPENPPEEEPGEGPAGPEKGGEPEDEKPPARAAPARVRPRLEPGKIMNPDLNRKECRRLLARWLAFQGGPEALGKVPVTEGGAARYFGPFLEGSDAAIAQAWAGLASEKPLEAFAKVELEGGDRACGERAFRLRLQDRAGRKVLASIIRYLLY